MSRAEFTIEEVKSVFTPKAVIEAGYNVKPELAGRLEWPAAATLEAEEGFTIVELKEAGAHSRSRVHFKIHSSLEQVTRRRTRGKRVRLNTAVCVRGPNIVRLCRFHSDRSAGMRAHLEHSRCFERGCAFRCVRAWLQ